jgi:hypothetical protein
MNIEEENFTEFHADLPEPDHDAIMNDETGHLKRAANLIRNSHKMARRVLDDHDDIDSYHNSDNGNDNDDDDDDDGCEYDVKIDINDDHSL